MRHRAREQLRAIAAYLERERPGYGRLFVDALEEVLRRIAEMPDSFSPVPERAGVRKGLLGSPFSKFVVYFHTDERASTVLAVLHTARNPEAWKA